LILQLATHYSRRKEEGRRKKEEGRRKKEGRRTRRRKKEVVGCVAMKNS